MADFTIINESSLENMSKEVKRIISTLNEEVNQTG